MGNGEWECRMEIRMSISCCTWLAQFFWTKEKLPRLWLLLLFLLLFLCCCCGALNAENPCCINNVRIMVQEAVQLHKYACAAIKKLLSVPGPERERGEEGQKSQALQPLGQLLLTLLPLLLLLYLLPWPSHKFGKQRYQGQLQALVCLSTVPCPTSLPSVSLSVS